MSKFFKLLGSFAGGAILTGGGAYLQSGNPIFAIVTGVLGGVAAATGHTLPSPFTPKPLTPIINPTVSTMNVENK